MSLISLVFDNKFKWEAFTYHIAFKFKKLTKDIFFEFVHCVVT